MHLVRSWPVLPKVGRLLTLLKFRKSKDSSFFFIIDATVAPRVPDAVSSFTFNQSQSTVYWSCPRSSGGVPILGYLLQVRRGLETDPSRSWLEIPSMELDSSLRQYRFHDLDFHSLRGPTVLRLVALNRAGKGPSSTIEANFVGNPTTLKPLKGTQL